MTAPASLEFTPVPMDGVCQCCEGTFRLTSASKIPAHPWPTRDGSCHGSRRVPLRLVSRAEQAAAEIPSPPGLPPMPGPPTRRPVLKGVCGAGTGPCSATNARLFTCGWRCEACAPTTPLTAPTERTTA